jgi:cell wall-active antibiotic response 4TMS protein YvqF
MLPTNVGEQTRWRAAVEPTPLQAQQAAIQEVRVRYERGELSFDDFKRALDALMLARDADECQAVLRALPASSHATALAALDPPALPAVSAPLVEGQRKRIVAFMGEVQLDLNLAELPPQVNMQLSVIMGSVILYVPPSARVTVRSTVLLGEANALGENTNGVVAFGHEQHDPADAAPRADIEIEAFILMGSVKVVLAEKPPVSISEMVRNALRAAAEGMQRGLQAPAPQASLDAPRGQPQLPRAAEPPRRDV